MNHRWIFVLFFSLLLFSCAKENATRSFDAVIDGFSDAKAGSEKVYLLENMGNPYFCWLPEEGDVVRINGGNYPVNTESSSRTRILNVEEASAYYAVYPYSCVDGGAAVGAVNTIHIPERELLSWSTIGGEDRQRLTCPMAAYSAGEKELRFRNVCEVIAFHIKGSGVLDSISIQSDHTPLAGTFSLSIGRDNLSLSGVSTSTRRVVAFPDGRRSLSNTETYDIAFPLPSCGMGADQFTVTIFMQNDSQSERYVYSHTLSSVALAASRWIDINELTLNGTAVSNWNLSTTHRGDNEQYPILLNSWPASFTSDKYYKLENVTTLDRYGWIAVDNQHAVSTFSAHLDGGGYTVHLTNTALLNTISGTASIKNITLANETDRRASSSDFGTLANTVDYDAVVVIDNCHSTNNVVATANQGVMYLGGLVGNVRSRSSVTIANSSNQSKLWGKSISSQSNIGGLVGYSAGSSVLTITNSYSFGDQLATSDSSSNTFSGGLIGSTKGTVIIENCYGYITRNTGSYQGGLIGNVSNPAGGSAGVSFENSYYYVGRMGVSAIGKIGAGVTPTGTSYRLNDGRTYSGGSLAEALNGWVQSHGANHTRWKNGTAQTQDIVVFVTQ